ncbi:hypothetical protein MHL31_14945 [Lutibacter sp. A80]|uniref:hypothetical protein n=1 Tax=Lutibacter sp. A80 TaxID=2918453 RepID=UPI001F06E0D6|nr:hypothetical protein [Lutibacter sp. A80]UMB60366.1 hypothetical protein MHL31_14945 [Lutibacter sp. A80]
MVKELLIGFIVGLITTASGTFIFIEFFSKYDFYTSLDLIKEGNLEGKVLSLGAIANFFVFYIFLKKKQIYRARGVLFESFFIAFLVLLLILFQSN